MSLLENNMQKKNEDKARRYCIVNLSEHTMDIKTLILGFCRELELAKVRINKEDVKLIVSSN